MDKKDQMNIPTKLSWHWTENDRQFRYIVDYEGRQYNLIRNQESPKWHGMETVDGKIQLLNVPPSNTVNELVLLVEQLICENT